MELAARLDTVAAESGFSGAIRVDVDGATEYARAFGLADRAHGVANTLETQFAIASGTKGLTALTVMRLVERGELSLTTRARELLGTDLPLIDDTVTVEQLLAHRSGIGDYLDESAEGAITDYVMNAPVHTLYGPEQFLGELDGHAQVSPPGEQFTYNNGGYVVLALLAARASGRDYFQLVDELVVRPAGLRATAFLRSDELPAGTARHYLDATGLRTNALHVPVRGCGDGGAYSTLADAHALWTALGGGAVITHETYAAMVAPRSTTTSGKHRYGLGFWLGADGDDSIQLEGYDAGISFRTVHRPSTRVTYTVAANWSDGAWPIAEVLEDEFSSASG